MKLAADIMLAVSAVFHIALAISYAEMHNAPRMIACAVVGLLGLFVVARYGFGRKA